MDKDESADPGRLGYHRDYDSRWGSSQKTSSKEQTWRHKSCPPEAPPTPSPGSPPRLSVLSLLRTFPQLQARAPSRTGLPACLPAWPLDSLEAPPFLSLSPSTQKGSNFLHHFLPQLLGLADSTSFSPGDGERALSPCTPLFSFMEIAGLRALSHPSTSGKGRIWTRAQTQA